MAKITAIHSGGDWYDASATYVVLPAGMDMETEKENWDNWYRNEYCPAMRRGEKSEYIGLHEWVLRNGARETMDDELEIFEDL